MISYFLLYIPVPPQKMLRFGHSCGGTGNGVVSLEEIGHPIPCEGTCLRGGYYRAFKLKKPILLGHWKAHYIYW